MILARLNGGFLPLLVIACSISAFAEDEVPFPAPRLKPITLRQAVAMALENNLESSYDRTAIGIEAARVRHAQGNFDPVFNINTSREAINRPQNPNDINSADAAREERLILAEQQLAAAINGQQGGGAPPTDFTSQAATVIFEQQSLRSSSSLEGRTSLGTRYSLTLEASRFRNSVRDLPGLDLPEYVTFAGLTVQQPLLRDFGADANLAEIRVARKNKQVAELTWKLRVTNTVHSVMTTYYEMLYGYQNIRVRQEAVEGDKKLAHENQRRLDLGFMSPIDVRQAEVAVSVDEEELIAARNFFSERQFALKRQILKELDLDESAILVPQGSLEVDVTPFHRPELMRTALRNRLDYQSAVKEAEREAIRLKFARNQMWPKLDLVATYGFNGLADSFGSSLSQALHGSTPQWTLGIVASIPLGNNQARAQRDIALGAKEQAILRVKQTELSIGVDVDTVLSRIALNQQRLATSRSSRRLAEETVNTGQKRLEEGLSSSFDVIELNKKLYDARTRELAALVELNKSVLQLWLATGTLLERESIFLEN